MSKPQSIKVVLLGDSSCGKTSLTRAWMLEDGPTKTEATVGASFRRQFVDLDDTQYCIDIWDTAGDEKYSSTIPIYCRNACGAFIVFDLTRPETFSSVSKWVEILNSSAPDAPYILIGNKIDLINGCTDMYQPAVEFGIKNNIQYFETSALTGAFVEEAFGSLAILAVNATKTIVEKAGLLDIKKDQPRKQEKSGCC